jgi:hypothetical protein
MKNMSPNTISYLCFLLVCFLFLSTTSGSQNKEKKEEKLSLKTLVKRKTIKVFYSKSIVIFVGLNFLN